MIDKKEETSTSTPTSTPTPTFTPTLTPTPIPTPTPTPVQEGFLLWRGQRVSPGNITAKPPGVLVLLLTWLFCKPGSASRYVRLYTARGYDVLQVSSQLAHFLWPRNSKRFARDLGKVLQMHFADYDHIMVHAMSIGACNYTTCQMLSVENPQLETYLFSKLRAVVFDSLTMGSLDHMIQGIAVGVSDWSVVQKATASLANLYFFVTSTATKDVLIEAVEFFKNNPAPVPTLVLASRDDPMCDADVVRSMVQDWKVKDKCSVTFQLWERSGHCAHLIHHGNQYVQLLNDFLTSVQPCLLHNEPRSVKSNL